MIEHASDTGALMRFDTDKLIAIELVHGPTVVNERPAPTRMLAAEVAAACERLASARAANPHVVLGIAAVIGDGRAVEWAMPDPEPTFGPWPTSIAGFRLIGDALRRDQLGLWRQLEHAPLPPWGPGTQLTDVVGLGRRLEDHPDPGDEDDVVSGTARNTCTSARASCRRAIRRRVPPTGAW